MLLSAAFVATLEIKAIKLDRKDVPEKVCLAPQQSDGSFEAPPPQNKVATAISDDRVTKMRKVWREVNLAFKEEEE